MFVYLFFEAYSACGMEGFEGRGLVLRGMLIRPHKGWRGSALAVPEMYSLARSARSA